MKEDLGDDKQSKSKWRRMPRLALWIAGAVVVVVGLAVLMLALSNRPTAGTASPSPTRTTTSAATAAPFVTPGPQTAVALAAGGASDAFDSWIQRTSSPKVIPSASDEAHSGKYAMLITSTAPSGAVAAQWENNVALQAGGDYTATLWVKSSGTSANAVTIRPAVGWEPSLKVPAGTYDWQQISVDFHADGATAPFRIVVTGPTSGLLLDDLSVVPKTGNAAFFDDPGFEANSADLAITNTTLVFADAKPAFSLATRRAPGGWLAYSITSRNGAVVARGNAIFEGLASKFSTASLPDGYYTLNVTAHIGGHEIARSTPFIVVPKPTMIAPLSESPYGIHVHSGPSDARNAAMVSTLASLGFGHVRADVPWNQIELSPEKYTYPPLVTTLMKNLQDHYMTALQVPVYANKLYDGGLTPSSPTGLAAYGRFASNIVQSFPSVGQDVEVYNEFDHFFNNGACGRTAACYIQMLDAVRAAVPAGTTVAGPGNAGMGFKWPFLEDFARQGGMAKVDVVTAHPYTQPKPASDMGDDLERLRALIRSGNGGKDKPIWLSEMGWATVPDWVTPEQQAAYMVQTYAAAFSHGVQRVYWYEAVDQRPNPMDYEGSFGLFTSDRTLLPNANAPKLGALAQGVFAAAIGNRSTGVGELDDAVKSYRFDGRSDSLNIAWSNAGTKQVTIKTSKPVTVVDIFGASHKVKPSAGVVKIPVGVDPLYIYTVKDAKVSP